MIAHLTRAQVKNAATAVSQFEVARVVPVWVRSPNWQYKFE
jgi:hypothetical protein